MSTTTDGRAARAAQERRAAERRTAIDMRRRKAELLNKTRERRAYTVRDRLELRESSSEGTLKFSGYACLVNHEYDVGFYVERVERGAFKRTLSESPDVQLLINHGEAGSGMPIARTGHNMQLTEDVRGLRVDADLDADDPDVQLLARKMRGGLIDQMSFAFQVTDQQWNKDYTERSLRQVSLHRGDVSIVNQGANGATVAEIAMRSRGRSRRLSAAELRVISAHQRARADAIRRRVL
jgi:HK97 family phage prohead protease